MTTLGIDISYYQGGINLSLCKENGFQFVIARLSKGNNYRDPTFDRHHAMAKEEGVLFAAYHYLRSDSSPESQVEWVYDCLPDKSLPVMLDVERHQDGISKPTYPHVLRFLAAAESADLYVPLLYLPRWYWSEIGAPMLPDFPRLVSSRYGTNDGHYQGDSSALWSAYGGQDPVLLQFTSRGTFRGYTGPVDLDAYRGSRESLASLGLFADFGGSVATSQNGWPVVGTDQIIDKKVLGVEFPNGWLKGDIDVIFTDLIVQLNKIEPIRAGWCWGYYVKRIEGTSTYSNHASGTAIDYNAPEHPMGSSGTWGSADTTAIRSLLRNRYQGLIRWGGDYSGRKDEMHFEFIGTKAQADSLASKLSSATTVLRKWPMVSVDGYTLAELKLGDDDADYDGYNMVWRLQKMLRVEPADGIYGPITQAAVRDYMGSGDGSRVGLAEWVKLYGLSTRAAT